MNADKFFGIIAIILILGIIIEGLIGISKIPRPETTWEITKTSGEKDTIIAQDYWILTRDTMFVKFVTDSGAVIYSRSGLENFRKIKN